MTTAEKLAQLDAHSARVLRCGGPKAVEKQHALGKRTARERIELLMDTGTFTEVDRFVRHRCTSFGMGDKDIPADGVVTGYGKIDGRTVFVYAQDFTAQGGSLGRDARGQDLQNHGHGSGGGLPRGGPVRLRRRPHSGGGGRPVRLWADFLPQRLLFRTYPADLRHHGSLRGRRGLLPRPDGPDCHGGKGESDVYHRSRGGSGHHGRGDLCGRIWAERIPIPLCQEWRTFPRAAKRRPWERSDACSAISPPRQGLGPP